ALPILIRQFRPDKRWVNMFLNRQNCIEKTFHFIAAMNQLITFNPFGCRCHALDHIAPSVGKSHIIFEKITMCQDMCNNQLILDQTIRIKQKSIAWVGIDDELVNLAQPEVIMQFHFMELLTKTPMGKPCWHAICSKCINDISRAY